MCKRKIWVCFEFDCLCPNCLEKLGKTNLPLHQKHFEETAVNYSKTKMSL